MSTVAPQRLDPTITGFFGALNGHSMPAGAGGSSGAAVDPQAARLGLKCLTFAPEVAHDILQLNSGVTVYELVYVPANFTLTYATIAVRNGAATPGGNNTMAVYTSAGVKIDETADMTVALESSNTWALGAFSGGATLTGGTSVYIGALTHYVTGPQVLGSLTGGGGGVPIAPVNGLYASVFDTGIASFPASFDPSTLSRNSGGYVMGLG